MTKKLFSLKLVNLDRIAYSQTFESIGETDMRVITASNSGLLRDILYLFSIFYDFLDSNLWAYYVY